MSDEVLRAAPISWNQIASIAEGFRRELHLGGVKYFPIMDVLERVLDQRLNLVRIEVEEDDLMGEMEGLTDPGGAYIRFSQKVYLQAHEGKPRARWTAAHEAGHFFLHANKPLARLSTRFEIESLKAFECPERQAHQFAAELLMPRSLLTAEANVADIMSDFGVSEEAATRRLKFIASLQK